MKSEAFAALRKSGFGTSRHFGALRKFGRYRGIADFGQRSARQIYGFMAQKKFFRMHPVVVFVKWL
jgi:hypothetical protein